MPASEVIYAPGNLDLPALCFDQGSTARRQINGLTNTWNKIGIAFAMRAVGVSTLASAVVNESFPVSSPASRFAFGLKNNDNTLVGQSGCKFVGLFSSTAYANGLARYSDFRSDGKIGPYSGWARTGGGVISGVNEVVVLNANDDRWRGAPSSGTEATTNFCYVNGLTIEIVNRGTPGQQVILNVALPVVSSVITQPILETAILAAASGITLTVSCPHATYDLSDIDCVYIQWPFANNRLLVFGPTSGPAGSPFVMRLA